MCTCIYALKMNEKRNNLFTSEGRIQSRRDGLTLIEMILALSIIVIIFSAIVPLFRIIDGSWESKKGSAEAIQNGRALIEHLNYQLSRAVRIMAVSDSTETTGYIQFEANDGNDFRYEVNPSDYVTYGIVGDLSELAGPVSQFQFTCYDACDLDTAITDVNVIRAIKTDIAMTNSHSDGQDKTFYVWNYLRTSYAGVGSEFTQGTAYEYNSSKGQTPAVIQIDSNHYLVACRGGSNDAWAYILYVDPSDWTVSVLDSVEFDNQQCQDPTLAQIDSTHYLCVYEGQSNDGWACVLEVDTDTWHLDDVSSTEYISSKAEEPSVIQIDSTHFLITVKGPGNDGWAGVLSVDPQDWSVDLESTYEFDSSAGKWSALAQIDSTHYLCAYTGSGNDGWATILTVNTGNWSISKADTFEYDTSNGRCPALIRVDSGHYLCTYRGSGNDGFAKIIKVNTGSWTISAGAALEYDSDYSNEPSLAQISETQFLCAYEGDNNDGWAVILSVDTDTDTVSVEGDLYEFDDNNGETPALARIDSGHMLCAYDGSGTDGWVVVLMPGTGSGEIRP